MNADPFVKETMKGRLQICHNHEGEQCQNDTSCLHVSRVRTDILGLHHANTQDCCIRSAEDASDSRAEAPQEAGAVSKPEV